MKIGLFALLIFISSCQLTLEQRNPFHGLTLPLEVVATGVGKTTRSDPNYLVDMCSVTVKDANSNLAVIQSDGVCSLKTGDIIK